MIYLGETIRLKASSVTDLDGNAITIPTSITIVITKPGGSQTSITSGWVNDGLGNYHYDLQIQTTDPAGVWSALWMIVGSSTYTGIEKQRFTVESQNQ